MVSCRSHLLLERTLRLLHGNDLGMYAILWILWQVSYRLLLVLAEFQVACARSLWLMYTSLWSFLGTFVHWPFAGDVCQLEASVIAALCVEIWAICGRACMSHWFFWLWFLCDCCKPHTLLTLPHVATLLWHWSIASILIIDYATAASRTYLFTCSVLLSHVRFVLIMDCNLCMSFVMTYANFWSTYCACRLLWHVFTGFVPPAVWCTWALLWELPSSFLIALLYYTLLCRRQTIDIDILPVTCMLCWTIDIGCFPVLLIACWQLLTEFSDLAIGSVMRASWYFSMCVPDLQCFWLLQVLFRSCSLALTACVPLRYLL